MTITAKSSTIMEQRDAQHTRVRRFRKWESRTAELLPETVSCALLCVSQRDSSAGLRSMDIVCHFGNYYNFCLNFGVHFNCTVAFTLRIYSQTAFSRFFQKALDKPSALCYNRGVVRKKPVAAVFERARRCFCRCGGIGRRPGLKIP